MKIPTPASPRIVIQLTIESVEPLSGTASMVSGEERRFEGWLGLLGMLSELVEEAGPSDRPRQNE